jgi:hypothetical protein
MKSDMGIQLSPNVRARKDTRVLVPMAVRCPGGIASYAILVFIMISDLLFPDAFFTFIHSPRRKNFCAFVARFFGSEDQLLDMLLILNTSSSAFLLIK